MLPKCSCVEIYQAKDNQATNVTNYLSTQCGWFTQNKESHSQSRALALARLGNLSNEQPVHAQVF